MQEQAEKRTGETLSFVFRKIGTWFLWFATALGVLVLFSYLSACIPRSAIREKLLDSAEYLLASEKSFYQLREGDRRFELHNYADATTLNIMYSVDGAERFRELLISPFYSEKVNLEKTVLELLEERILQEAEADTVYDRYWHGMAMVLRPLFLGFTIQGIRWLFLGVLIVLLGVLTAMLLQRKQVTAVVVFLVGAMLVQLPVTAFCMEYIPTVWIMLLSSIVMIKCAEDRKKVLAVCTVSGVSVAFFDFLTTETLAFVMPLAIVYCIWKKRGMLGKLNEEVKFLMNAGLSWGAAYVGSYLVKWSLSSLVLRENRFKVAMESFLGRQGNRAANLALDSLVDGAYLSEEALQAAGGNILPQPVSAVVINLRLLLGLSGRISLESLALAGLFAVFLVFSVVFLYRKKKEEWVLPGVLLVLGLVPIARMLVLHNHSIEHCFFVYRALFGTIFCFTTGFIEVIDWKTIRRRRRK